ncbi:hypothetical protein [Halorarius halobius]|uniref:hypothetical protein n=1 Tax=Halorarius halobius TaxID=2962671 RepID=UPI0020CD1EDD|nr:hypothetical protein [Halorarius halobius]
MSTSSPSTQVRETLRDARGLQLTQVLRRPVEALAFWAAVLLPFAYVPLLVGGFGFDPSSSVALFGALLVANVVALLVGHDHNRTPGDR